MATGSTLRLKFSVAITVIVGLTILLGFSAFHGFAQASTFTVTNTNDTGPGSLRQSILDANSNAGLDVIDFSIPGAGPHNIQPTSALPTITDPVVIDGYTQPGASANTNGPGLGLNTVLKIELDGTNAGAPPAGLNIIAGGSTVRGLVINRFAGHGLQIHGIGAAGNQVHGNFIGTDVTGTAPLGNTGDGVFMAGGARLNVIGGDVPAARNLISGNGGNGVHIAGNELDTRENIVQGNLIGTDITGATSLANQGNGVILGTVADNLIGGSAPGARNIIAGNNQNGINICCGGTPKTL